MAASPLFHLSFETGTTAEARGNGRPLDRAPVLPSVAGVSGKAAAFGAAGALRFETGENLDKNEGTIAFWLTLTEEGRAATQGTWTLFAEEGPEEAGSTRMKIEWVSGKFIRVRVRDPKDIQLYYRNVETWAPGDWHHIAVTWNTRRGALLFVDGQPVAIGWMPAWTASKSAHFSLGPAQDEGGRAPFFALDEFSIAGREWSEAEVREAAQRHRTFPAEIDFQDPFFRQGEAARLAVRVSNPNLKAATLEAMRFELRAARGAVLQRGVLPEATLAKLGTQMVFVPLDGMAAGEHTLRLTYREGGVEREAAAQVWVMEPRPALSPQPSSTTLVDELEAAAQEPVAESGGTAIVEKAFGAYREGGMNLHDRFALDFDVREPNEPHVAVITYPDDRQRTMEVMLQDFGNTIDFQVHTGVFTGNEYPLSHDLREHRVVFWPRSKRQAFVFMTTIAGQPAAVHGIKVYRLSAFPVTERSGEFRGSVPPRSVGLYYEDPVLFHNFGTGRDLTGFVEATDRLVQYLRSFGQTEFEYPLAWYAGPLYGTAVETFEPDIDGAQGGARPHPPGYPRYLLQRLAENGIKFTAGLHLHTLPSLNQHSHMDRGRLARGEETVVNINKDGAFWYGHWHGRDPNYNPADPRVMAAVNRVVDEVAARYGQEPAFSGISLIMARPKAYTFGSLASGYNDSNLQRFQQASGIQIPGYALGDEDRFAKSYTWLMANAAAKRAWIDWRCRVLFEHYDAMARRLAAVRSDLKLKLNVFIHPSNTPRLANYENETAAELAREMGVDPALYAGHPHIVFAFTSVPADLRWGSVHLPREDGEVFRTAMTAPEVFRSLQAQTDVRVTIHDRYWEDPIGSEQPLAGLKRIGVNEMVWRASTFNGPGVHGIEPYVFALHHLDAASVVKGGYVVGTFGLEEYLLPFSRALAALPAVRFDDVPALSDVVRVRQKVVDGRVYGYALNTLPVAVTARLELSEATPLHDAVSGETLTRARSLQMPLGPYELRAFVGAGSQRVFDGSAEVPALWREAVEARLRAVETAAARHPERAREHRTHLEHARQLVEQKQYSRLYYLLQEYWVRAITGAPAAAPAP